MNLNLDVRFFQEFCTTDFRFVSREDKAVCALSCQSVVCQTSSIKRHFETKHKKPFKDYAEKIDFFKKGSITLRKAKRHFQESYFVARIEQSKVATKSQRALLNMENHLLMNCL